jgi:Ser/Thr protein kinase RdoA (MazF antagonist)
VLIATGQPLQLAFEAALYDLLGESRYPAPRPRRASTGALIARLDVSHGFAAAACYPWPAGELLPPEEATIPQLLELGRLLARLHHLGEAHPASIADPCDGSKLLARLKKSDVSSALQAALATLSTALPTGACHGGLSERQALFIGDRCSAILPGGCAVSAPLALDLAETLVSWALPLPHPEPALRAIVSGYQALRRLASEEREALWACVRHAAAREGARRLLANREDPLGPLEAAERLGPEAIRSAAG